VDSGENYMTAELPPQIQNQIAQLQQLQQQIQGLAMQKSKIEAMQNESKMALDELAKLTENVIVYRNVGELLIKTSKEESISKLKEREETLSLRLQSISRQEERLTSRFKQLQEQIQHALGPRAQ
jgi:prefoldin beta subunit